MIRFSRGTLALQTLVLAHSMRTTAIRPRRDSSTASTARRPSSTARAMGPEQQHPADNGSGSGPARVWRSDPRHGAGPARRAHGAVWREAAAPAGPLTLERLGGATSAAADWSPPAPPWPGPQPQPRPWAAPSLIAPARSPDLHAAAYDPTATRSSARHHRHPGHRRDPAAARRYAARRPASLATSGSPPRRLLHLGPAAVEVRRRRACDSKLARSAH
jgi:hypothetical protein